MEGGVRGRPLVHHLHLSDVPVPGLRQEDQADDEGHRRDHNRIPEAGIDVASRRHDREHGRWQEAAEPAI
jgi:hypothetical protein